MSQRRVWIPGEDYTELVQRKSLKHTYLFKKLVRKVAHKWVAVLRVTVNEVDKCTTVRIFNELVEPTNGSDIYVPLAASTQTLIIRIRNFHSLTHTSNRLSVKPLSSARMSGSSDIAAIEDCAF